MIGAMEQHAGGGDGAGHGVVVARLGPLLALVAMASMGTGALTNGVFFIARSLYGFDRVSNWALALLAAGMYVVGALSAGPVVGLIKRRAWLTSRRVLIVLLAVMGGLCVVPALVRVPLALWVFHGSYHLCAGVLWPLVESYQSGGRRGAELRRAMGWFNVTWAATLPVAFWAMARFLPEAEVGARSAGEPLPSGPFVILAGLAVLHIGAIVFAVFLPRDPARHADGGGGVAAEDRGLYAGLLASFRVALVTSYVLMSAISPALPDWTAELGVAAAWRTPVASAWMAVRVGMFVLLMRWHGWHGRQRTLVWSVGSMVVGAAMCFLAGSVGVLVAGLALVGVGMGATYAGAIYYAMAVGDAEVDAGGKHETFIGLGYMAGPGCSLVATAVVGMSAASASDPARIDSVALGILGVLAAVLIGMGVRGMVRGRKKVES